MAKQWSVYNEMFSNLEHVSTGLDHITVSIEVETRYLLNWILKQKPSYKSYFSQQQHRIMSLIK